MTWAQALPTVLLAAAVLLWPAPVLLGAVRLPPLAAVAVAPAVGVLVLVASAIIADLAGASWGWPWVLGVALVLVGGLVASRHLVRRRRNAPPPESTGSPAGLLTYVAGIVASGLVLGPRFLDALVSPDAFSQRYDNVFHLNVAHLAASGSASPLHLEPLTTGFYPAAWHDWVGFVMQLGGVDALVASQACSLVVIFALWPVSVAWLVETAFPPGVAGRLAVGPLALASVSFPLTLTAWGTLYPNLLGLSLAPVVLAIGWDALGRRERPVLGLASAVTLGVLTGAAVALSHPNAALSAGLLLLPVAVAALWPLVRHRDLGAVRASRPWTIAVVAFVLAFPVVWYVMGNVIAAGSIREPFLAARRALGDILGASSLGRPPVPPLAIGLVVGLLVLVLVPRLRPLLASFALVSAAYFAAVSLPTSPGALLLTAPYYTDPYRIAATATLLVVPLAVLGWDTAARLLGDHLPPVAGLVGAGLLASALLAATAQSEGLRIVHDEVRVRFDATEDAWLLTPDERAIIERLPRTTEPDAVIVVNPYQGGSLAYALADRGVTHHYMNTAGTEAAQYLERHLRDAATDPAVCAAVAETGARYALVLEPFEIKPPVDIDPQHPGLRGLDTAPGFERVDSEGATALYRITACG
ncbi:MAG TPA: hypothetical protein GXZ45_02960 [Propionibacterium sp.]|nr:hypothetical protein [Propionibacterium sp.]